MTTKKQHMSNPKNFCQEAKKHGITYEYLIEGKESINCTNLARMFIGKSSRGGLSTDIIDTWIATFEYVKENPDEEDHDQYTARRFEPTQEYHDYVKLIKTPIKDDVIESWKKISSLALGRSATQYGYTIGIANNKALRTLHERMQKMAERRKNNIWNKNDDDCEVEDDNVKQDYRMMNVPDLRKLCKERNLQNAHIKTKDGLIKLLERNPLDSIYNEKKIVYNSMSMKDLKVLARDRGFTSYNNLTKDELIKNHQVFDELKQDKEIKDEGVEESKEYDDGGGGIEESKEQDDCGGIEESKEQDDCGGVVETKEHDDGSIEENKDNLSKEKTEEEKEFTINECKLVLKNGDNFMIPIRKDGMVNATELCKAGNKKFNHYHNLKQTQEFIKELEIMEKIPESKLIIVKHGGDFSKSVINNLLNSKVHGTWIHRKVAYNLAQWISPYFAVQVSKILDELFTKGEVKLQRPIHKLLDLSEIDIEAEELEMKYDWSLYTNKSVLYIAYIGKSLVKIGYSDCRIHQREKKHTGSESKYEQFRMIKAFEVSGEPVEKKIKELLNVYNVKFHNQSEIYKPPNTLSNFIDIVENLVRDNDLRYQLDQMTLRENDLRLRIKDLEIELLNLRIKHGGIG